MKMNSFEEWKDIPNYEGHYKISNLGRLKSLKYGKEKIINGSVDKHGYLKTSLSVNGKSRTVKFHQLVAIAFLNHTPCGMDLVVDHIDNNQLNNKLDNLRLVSNRENLSKIKKSSTSIFTGVSWSKANRKWRSSINKMGKTVYLGYYDNEIDAHKRYKEELKTIKK